MTDRSSRDDRCDRMGGRVCTSLLSAIVPWLASACSLENTGVVELNWVVVDRDGEAIFPAGQFMASGDTCDLPGRRGDASVRYDLEVELGICDPSCDAGCNADECQIVAPTRYPCSVARGTDRNVPASEDPYLFTVRAVIAAPGGECRELEPPCIATPGPRERTVLRGLVTDLQVFQIIVNSDIDAGDPLDLEACGCA
jgi:hypothetical protein